MLVTDNSGLRKINIFKNKRLKQMVVLLNYILKDLEDHNVIMKVK